jgi:thioesterase domain-containing protein
VLDVINRPLDLRRHGVMRVDVWPIADTGAVLIVWTLHHIAIDEASIDRALFELDELLKGVTLQPVYGSPLGFATFEKAWTDRDGVRGWQTTLVNALGPVRAPLPRAPGRGAEFVLSLPADLSTALHAACSRWGATPFAPLLTAYGLAVQDVFGSAYRFVTTPFSRRVEAELVEPVGCLLDMHFVEAGARDSETDIGALARVRDTVLALQRPVFQPQRELAMAVGKVAPHVGAQLNAFGFTWRLNPSRIVPLGTERATVLRVPQQGARFGVTLHAWLDGDTLHCSIEALTAAIDDGRARALGDAFVRRLQALFAHRAIPAFAHTPATDAHGTRTDYAGDYSGRLRRAWSQWLNIPVGGIVDSSDFLRSGGNSLTAMRMTAQLRREHGLSIGTGEFLSRPTFQNLRALAREGIVGKSDFTELIGAADAERFVVFLPGNVGPTIEVYQLCLEVQRQLGAGFAVLIVDLEAILARAPDGLLAQYVAEHVALLLSEVGWERVVALAGYSSGGLLALELAQGAPGGRSPMVWLLDTYAPLTKAHTRLRAVLRPNVVGLVRAAVAPVARPLLRNARIAGMLRTHVRPREPQPVASIDHLTQRRLAYHDALYGRWRDSAFGETHLLQARDTIRLMNLVWRRASNGFTPAQHRVWQVHQLDGNHKDIPASRAGDIAALISERLRRAALTETDE